MQRACVLFVLLLGQIVSAQTLSLPPRPANAPGGSELLGKLAGLNLDEREKEMRAQILAGNIPDFLRHMAAVKLEQRTTNGTNHATIYVTRDYLAVGSDKNYALIPISPMTGQRIADALNCSLPTPRMVDAIYLAAEVKLAPAPIPPSAAMTTAGVFSNHNWMVATQRMASLAQHPLGALVAGHKKDVVISARLEGAPGKVAIYGWHQTNGVAIQPLYLGHTANWVDYSQCTRLVSRTILVNGEARDLMDILGDSSLAGMLSDEGVIRQPRYDLAALAPAQNSSARTNSANGRENGFNGFHEFGPFHERTASFTFEPEVKVHINAPAEAAFAGGKRVMLIFYGLPNGNTTSQTIGKKPQPNDDWHYDIQHIGAQTRFLREVLPERVVVLACLESGMKSWPAWRKKYGDPPIAALLAKVKGLFSTNRVETVLSGHSGGGSFIFGYLNTVTNIPDDIARIAFLDSNYAYSAEAGEKLARWLAAPGGFEKSGASARDASKPSQAGDAPHRFLCVLAYNDAVALLDGKPFVSAAGGTWGKSHEMLKDLGERFKFDDRTNGDLQVFTALGGRARFLLMENPEGKILHTVQVERNGFIHSMVSGTTNENRGYEYLGARAYTKWIADTAEE